MPRLPQPGGDENTWGTILNNFLSVEHKADGTLKKAGQITQAQNDASQALTNSANAQNTADNAVQSVSAGSNVTVDNSDPQNPVVSASPGGSSDHGGLTGLGDDDHPQYHTDARGDARYYTQSQLDTSLSGKSDTGHNHDSDYATTAQGTLADSAVQPGDNVSDLTNDANYATTTDVSSHEADTTSVHGIADTANLETQAGAQTKADTAESNANTYTDNQITAADVGNATQIQGRTVDGAAPAADQVIAWNDTSSQWEPQTIASGANHIEGDGIAKITVNSTAPSSPAVGDIWVQTS